jgi:hypothetical protein
MEIFMIYRGAPPPLLEVRAYLNSFTRIMITIKAADIFRVNVK